MVREYRLRKNVRAIQFTGSNEADVIEFVMSSNWCSSQDGWQVKIDDVWQDLSVTDWIVRSPTYEGGVKLIIFSQQAFNKMYQPAE